VLICSEELVRKNPRILRSFNSMHPATPGSIYSVGATYGKHV
jgi:hypothetical protein